MEPWATVWLHGFTVPRLNRGTVCHGLAPRFHGLAPRFHGSTVQPWNRGPWFSSTVSRFHGSTVEPWATVWLHGSTVPRLNRGNRGNRGTVGGGNRTVTVCRFTVWFAGCRHTQKLTLLGGKDMLASEMSQMVSQRICVPVFSFNPGCAPIG